jgi:sirohydrochlorin cobaltochelatase
MSVDDREALEALEQRIRTILPPEYQDSYQDLEPIAMGSAGLKYGADGKVAWDEIWGSFCDLAMAGGPPHKGRLLEPGRRTDIDAGLYRYERVTEEICRGIRMAANLDTTPSPVPGWVRVTCSSDGMSEWLVRAIVMENVAARVDGPALDVPAAPHFRIEKEIRNVVTVVAKTCHYWAGHIPLDQQRAIATMFAEMSEDAPLIGPPDATENDATDNDAGLEPASASMAATVQHETGLVPSRHRSAGWLGVECPSLRGAVWMMRAMVVNNVLSRREGTVLFVPVNPHTDPEGEGVANTLIRVHTLAAARGVI